MLSGQIGRDLPRERVRHQNHIVSGPELAQPAREVLSRRAWTPRAQDLLARTHTCAIVSNDHRTGILDQPSHQVAPVGGIFASPRIEHDGGLCARGDMKGELVPRADNHPRGCNLGGIGGGLAEGHERKTRTEQNQGLDSQHIFLCTITVSRGVYAAAEPVSRDLNGTIYPVWRPVNTKRTICPLPAASAIESVLPSPGENLVLAGNFERSGTLRK